MTGILIVSDNDSNPEASFQMVRGLVHEAEFKVGNKPLAVHVGPPAVVILMLPWTGINGQIETLCLEALKDTWPAQYACAETYTQCCQIQEWTQGKKERASFRALISHICRDDPNTSLQHAWSRPENLIPLAHHCFDQVANFLANFDATITAAQV